MNFSVTGIAISTALLLLVVLMRAGPLAGLLGSLAFGATSIASIPALGGSSPLISVVFVFALYAAAGLNRDAVRNLGSVFRNIKTAWVVLAFMIYSVFSALVFPRLFAGATNVFVVSREMGGVFEVPLQPVSANISQAGYLVLNCLTFFAVAMLLMRRFRLRDALRGFFLLCWINAGLGLIDFIGKYSGLGDVLSFIRTANYAQLTNVETLGFARITGGFAEASAFGSASLTCLAFAFTYWRRRRTTQSFWLTVITFFLLLASTSTTAYAGLAVLCIPVAISIIRQLATRATRQTDLYIVSAFFVAVMGILTTTAVNPQALTPVAKLIDTVVFEKSKSGSAQERAYWNRKSLQSVADTGGVGVGFGSSRASSWPIAVVSQLGIVGVLFVAFLLGVILRGLRGLPGKLDPSAETTVDSVRACALAGVVSTSISGGGADPGAIFFIALAIVAASRAYVIKSVNQPAARIRPGPNMIDAEPSRA